MNKIFKTKYDVTTGQTKVVSELANNRQVASRVEGASGRQPKCGVFLGMFKILPLALLMSELLSSVAYGVNVWIDVNPNREPGGDNKPSSVWYERSNVNNTNEVVLLADGANKTGANTRLTNKDFKKTVVIGSRAVGGGNDATAIGYRAIVGKNLDSTNITDSHQGTAVGYRAFSYGNESVSLGNDTVARGSNSIAIGSDNISGENAKPLPKEIFTIFLDNAANFNYTGEYAAVDYNKLFEGTDVIEKNTNKNKYVNGDGNLVSDDGFTIGWNGRYYIRKTKSNHKDYYVLIGDQYYEKLSNGNLNPIEKPKNIEQMDDYKRMEKYNGYLEKAYEKYLADTDRNKKTHTWARGNNSIAIGGRSVAYGNYSTALGTYAIAYKDYSAAIGTNTIAFGRNSLVFGNDSYVYADRSVGVGTNVQAVNAGSMVYGSDSYSGGSGSLAMGNYALANIAMDENFTGKGLKSSKLLFTDNANKDEYKDDKYFFDKFYELGNTKDIQHNRTSIKPKTTKQRGTGEEKAEQSKDNKGKHNQGAIAIGSYTVALGDNALSIGRYAYAKEDSTVAIGRFAFAKEANAFALGSFTRALEKSSIALGNEATATLENSVALGYKSKTDYEHSKSDPYTPEGAIIIPTSANVGVISVGYNGYERRMVNVAAGSQDTDAVNVAQLKALETRIDLNNKQNNLTPYFGVEQKSGDSAKIAQGQEAKQNYERYVKLAGEYAKLLNRKVNGKETFKQEALDKVKKELDALEKSNPQIATKASTIKKIVEDLGKETVSDSNKLLTKLKEITQAVETDMAKKDQVANLSEQEIEESNYKGSLAKGKDSIAIGYKASVAEVAEDSVAIGKGSKVTAKQEAKNKAEINGVEFTFKGGVSPDNKEESKKTIFSVGDTNQERIIKNVAAGDVSENSTDAINGSQLYAVTKVFSDLAKDVIGVEVDNKQFKKSSFTAVEYISTPTSKKGVPDNFKDALDETIKAINQGYKFSDGTTNNNGTSKYYLGSTLEIKAGDIGNTHKDQNLKVQLDKSSNEKAIFKIGMTDSPSFKKVTITNAPKTDNEAVNKKYVDDKFKNVATSFKVTADSGEYAVKDALNIKGKEENSHKNITTTAKNGTKKELEISLNSTLKGITSIGKDENNQITFNGGTKIKAGGAVLSLSKTSDDKVKISGVADGVAENDVVNFKQLEASKLHFLSVQGTDKRADNYNNNGAKGTNSVAIGVGASTKSGASGSIAIGHDAKSSAENAVVIGNNVSVDVHSSFVLGSNNKVQQSFKKINGAVVVIGSGTELIESKSSIAIGAVKVGVDGTKIENAAWTASIGNKNKIKNGTDIVALGNNIKALDNTNEVDKSGTKIANNHLILIGNGATAETAQNSVLVGARSKAETGAKSAVIIGHSAKAETNAVGAVAIGQGATVKTAAGDSIALGQGSEATEKKEAFESTELTVGQNSLKISWNNAGTGKNKSVVSVGKVGAERLITNVAAGKVDRNSTDAINGGQLFSVIETFGKLGVEVLGAEVDNGTKEFKKSSFDKVNYHGQAKKTTDTFRDAINESITAINKGFKFGDGTNQEQLYLGSTIIIQEGDVETDYKGTNLKTKYEKDADGKVTLKIGMTESPTFKKVTITDEPTGDDDAVNKKYLDGKIQTVNATVDKGLSFQGNDGQSVTKKFGDTLKIVGEPNGTNTGILTTAPGNITVKKKTNSDDTLEIGLSKDLTGIESISNGNTQITLKDNKIELTPDTGAKLTLEKSGTDKVKISGLGDGKIAQDSNDAITGKQLEDLAGKLGVAVNNEKTGFTQPEFTKIKAGADPNKKQTTFKGAIDDLITAVNKGISFKGNDNASGTATMQLGGTLAFDSSGSANKKDITAKVTDEGNGNGNAKITLELNKANTVDENDERVVTSKAVADKLKNYTTTTALQSGFLKVDGTNIGDAEGKKTFGKNVGISEIKLGANDKRDTELVQAKALISYLKGTGDKSVKVSDNPETKADGEGSIAIGDKAVAENEGAIAIGYDTSAKNRRSVAIGREAQVLGEHATAIGYKNNVSGNDSGAFGKDNEIIGKHSYAVGAYNKIEGDHVYALGSNITITKDITNAVILGNKSTGVSNAVSVGGAGKDEQRRIVYVATPTDKYDAVNKKYVDDLTLSYKTNSDDKTKQSINLKTGALDFKKSENISVSVEADGKITHTLNNNLQEITSIKGGKDESGAKITLETAKKEISFNDSKLTNLADGEIGDSSKEAVTGKQLADLAKQLGIAVDTSDKTKFTAPTFDNFKLKDINGTDGTAPKNIVEGLKNAVSKLNEGLKFSADMPSAVANGTQNTPHYLGSTLSIVRLDMNQAGSSATPAPAGTSSQPNIAEFKGDNLITQYTREANGNAKIEIGFKNAPTFSKVMLAEEQTYNGVNGNSGSTDWKKELITKGYLEQALDKFKFKVENGSGKPIEIGRNDTLKFTSGQNIKVDLAKNGTTPSSTGSTSPSASASAPAPTPAAPAPASSAAPSSSSGGAGSNGGGSNSMASSGGSNGAGMATTKPTSTPTTTPTTTTPTTAVVTIGTTEELKNITSISSKPKAGSAGGSGTGSSAVGNQDEVTKLTLDAEKGATFQVGNQGTEVNINKDGISLTPQSKDGKATLNKDGLTVGDKEAANGDKTHTVYGKNGLTVKGKDGSKEVVSLKVADGENSQGNNGGNGQSATLAFAKIGNGSGAGTGADAKGTGTGKITGLADIKPDETDGSLAANKNYVDKKVSDLNNNRPFDFYLGNDKVVKDKDGNFKKLKDGKPDQALTEEEKKQVVIKAEPTTAPIGISNVASGLGITTPTDEQKEKLNQLAEKVSEKVTALGKKTKDFSEKAEKFADLELMVDSLKQTVDTMPDGKAKEKMREDLKKYQEQLSAAQEAKKNAKEAVESARNELIEANGDYNAFSEAIAKVEELVEPDSQAELSNVATIADVQAVAKSGLKFKGNDGVEVRKQLSETLEIKGEGEFNSATTAAGNIKVDASETGLDVKLSDQLKNMTSFETREVNGRKSTLNSNGLKVVDQDSEAVVTAQGTRIMGKGNHAGQSASYTLDGIKLQGKAAEPSLMATHAGLMVSGNNGNIVINGNRGEILIPDVKPDASGFVAVNKNYVDGQNNALRTQIHHADRRLRAGIAGANAAAALASVSMPGKSMVAIAAAGHDGESALAIGYSRISDNGKVMLKLQGNSNSQGKVSGAVSIGYQW